jgi:S1-C subfamily serine protease
LESFDKQPAAPAPQKRSTFDWVSEKASELKKEASHYLADKDNRQIAIEGVTLAAGLAASALLHVNLSKSGKLLEGLVAGRAETKIATGQFHSIAAEANAVARNAAFDKLVLATHNEHLNFTEVTSEAPTRPLLKPAAYSSTETLAEGGFKLPEDVKFSSAIEKPPNIIITEGLPSPTDHDFDEVVAKRFNINLNLATENSIGILHPRFRNGAKQLTMMKSLDRNLSLYGNNESGVGVLEYERRPNVRPYFKNADSVVQIIFSNGDAGVGTGTFISEKGLIATAAHVVPPYRDILVKTTYGQYKADLVARKYDAEFDMAAIQLRGVPEGLTFPVPNMTSAELVPHFRAATIGHPQGLSGRFASVGSYLNDLDYDGEMQGLHPTFLMDSVMPGNSGGPIFDREGNFAVILTKLFTPEESSKYAKINRALVTGNRIEQLMDFLKEQEVV